MDFPIKDGIVDYIFQGVTGRNFQTLCTSVPEDCILWHFIWVFTVCQSTPLGISSKQHVKGGNGGV